MCMMGKARDLNQEHEGVEGEVYVFVDVRKGKCVRI